MLDGAAQRSCESRSLLGFAGSVPRRPVELQQGSGSEQSLFRFVSLFLVPCEVLRPVLGTFGREQWLILAEKGYRAGEGSGAQVL